MVGSGGVGTDHEVEEDGGGDKRDVGDSHVEARATLFEKTDHTLRCGQTEGAAAGQQQGVCPPQRPRGTQTIRLTGSGRGAAHVHPDDRVRLLEDDGRAAGQALAVGGVANEHTGHVAKVTEHGMLGVRGLGGLRQLPLVSIGGGDPGIVAC